MRCVAVSLIVQCCQFLSVKKYIPPRHRECHLVDAEMATVTEIRSPRIFALPVPPSSTIANLFPH